MKEPFQSINEVSKQLDLPAHTLRYWGREFPAAIKPVTGAGGRRYYRADTVATLSKIKDLLYAEGYTIAGVKKLLTGGKLDGDKNPEPDNKKSKSDALKLPAGKNTKSESTSDSHEIQQAIDLLNLAKKTLN